MGSRYRRKSDGRWVAAISVGPRGKRRTIVRYAPRDDNTRRRADALLDELRGLARPATTSGRTTVGQYLRSWLDTAGRRSLKASTWTTYDVALRLHLEPTIGHVTLSRLTADDVDAMLSRLELEPKGQRNVLGFLGRVLDVALSRRLVTHNAARLVERPRLVRAEQAVLEPAAARTIMAAVRGDRLEALWIAALGTGLRQGELLGLRWSDVDLEAATLTVMYALVRTNGKYGMDEPKTARSRRAVALPAFVVEALRGHKARQLEERIGLGKPTEDGLVFVTARDPARRRQRPGGLAVNASWYARHFQQLLEAAGLPRMRLHDLRHGAVSLLVDAGAHPKVAQELLRHAPGSRQTFERYAHVTAAQKRDAVELLEKAVSG